MWAASWSVTAPMAPALSTRWRSWDGPQPGSVAWSWEPVVLRALSCWRSAAAGAKRVEVVARRPEQALEVAALAGDAGMVATVDAADAADLVVNATPVGMTGVPVDGSGELPFGLEPKRLGPGQLVADLIYAPATTPLLASARARGAGTCNGLGMLVHQAARQVTIWTGRDAPIEVMSAAALLELGKRAEMGKLREVPQQGETGPPG